MTVCDPRERAGGGFEARLLPMLLQAMEEQRVRRGTGSPSTRRIRRRTAAVALAVASLVVGTTVMVIGRSTIDVRAADALADPEGVVADLKDAGIEATILAVPVPRPMVGTWWHLYFAPSAEIDELTWAKLKAQVGVGVAQLPEEIRDAGRGIYHHEALELPRNLAGPVTLVVGRERHPGEAEAPMDNELAPNGAFWCLHLEDMPPRRAGETLDGFGYDVVWVYDTFETPGGESRVVQGPPPDSGITTAWFQAPRVVQVRIAPGAEVGRLRLQAATPTAQAADPSWAPDCPDRLA